VSGWLLDTILLYQLAREGGGRKPSFRDWVSSSEEPIFLSIISVVEINASIQKVHASRRDSRAAALDDWLQGILAHGDRIYPVDADVAMLAGVLMNRSRVLGGRSLPDLLLAATAKIRGHGLLTTRRSVFNPLSAGIQLLEPFEQGPPG
jgi:predicted nucleic acid-binding protein